MIVSLIVLLIAYYVVADRYTPFTVDAYVQAYVVQVAPQVGGQVTRVHVSEGDTVAKGSLLFELDPRPFEHKVAVLAAQVVEVEHQIKQLEAQLAAAKAQQRQLAAEADYARGPSAGSRDLREKVRHRAKYLDAVQKHKASDAALDKSARDVQSIEEACRPRLVPSTPWWPKRRPNWPKPGCNSSTRKFMPGAAGLVTNLQLREGAYAHVGQAVLACIDNSQWLIVANFREICLQRMQVGQPGLVAFQAIPGTLWAAHVRFAGSGVGQGQGTPSGMLPDVKNETRWIPAARRSGAAGVGRSERRSAASRHDGKHSVYVESDHGLNPVTRAVHKILAWLYFL